MKLLFVLAFVLVAASADEHAEKCLTGTAVADSIQCTTDADCVGTELCCSQVCTAIAVHTNVDAGEVDTIGPLTKEQKKALRQKKKAARLGKKQAKEERLATRAARKAKKLAAKQAKQARQEKRKQKGTNKKHRKERKGKKETGTQGEN